MSLSISQVKAELTILHAYMDGREAFEAAKRTSDAELKTRAHDVAASFGGGGREGAPEWTVAEPVAMELAWGALRPRAFTMHKTDLLECLRSVRMQLSHNLPENERMHKERVRHGQQHLKSWELS